MRKGLIIAFVAMMGAGLLIFNLIRTGVYPVVLVNKHPIMAWEFNEASASVVRYYGEVLKTYKETDPSLKDKQVLVSEVRRVTLDKLIENVFIEREFKSISKENIDKMVDGKIEQAKKENPAFEQNVQTLYGLTIERFKEIVLKAQAREDVVKTKNTDYGTWLTDQRKKASIVMFMPDLQWDGEKVINK